MTSGLRAADEPAGQVRKKRRIEKRSSGTGKGTFAQTYLIVTEEMMEHGRKRKQRQCGLNALALDRMCVIILAILFAVTVPMLLKLKSAEESAGRALEKSLKAFEREIKNSGVLTKDAFAEYESRIGRTDPSLSLEVRVGHCFDRKESSYDAVEFITSSELLEDKYNGRMEISPEDTVCVLIRHSPETVP